jgi:hypothetical protein
MARVRSIRALKGAVLSRRVPAPRPRYDGQGQGGGQAAQTPGAVPGGGAGTSGAGAPGVSVPSPTTPAAQPAPTTAPSGGAGLQPTTPAAGQVGQPGQQQPGQVPGQPANPMAAFQGLPPQALALVQQWQRAHQWAQQNQHFAALGYQQWQAAQGRQGQPQPAPGQPAAPPPPKNPFGVPSFDLRNLDADPAEPGERAATSRTRTAPPGLLQQAHGVPGEAAEATHDFFQDPRAVLRRGIVKEIAAEVAQQTTSSSTPRCSSSTFAQQHPNGPNPDWLYEKRRRRELRARVRRAGRASRCSGSRGGGSSTRRSVAQLAQAQGSTTGRMQHELASNTSRTSPTS